VDKGENWRDHGTTEHYQKIMGAPNKKADLNAIPKPVKYFYYFIMGFLVIAFILMLYVAIFK
jgi:hypothetical protein